jgi:hypothetical protein
METSLMVDGIRKSKPARLSVAFRWLPHRAAFGVLLMGLASCAPVPTVVVDQSLKVSAPDNAGKLVGTIGARLGAFNLEASPYVYNTLMFRRAGTTTGGALEFSPPDPPIRSYTPDYQDDRFKANTFAVDLPPGDYEFYSYRFYYNNGSVEKTFSPKAEFSIPFKIERGKATYVGSLIAWGVWGRNFLGIPIPAGGYFVVTDQSARDLPLIAAKHPGMDRSSVSVVPLQPTPNSLALRTEPIPRK